MPDEKDNSEGLKVQKNPLEFVSTDDLIRELSKRSTSIVVAMSPTNGEDRYLIEWTGNLTQCIGLCTLASRAVIRANDKSIERK